MCWRPSDHPKIVTRIPEGLVHEAASWAQTEVIDKELEGEIFPGNSSSNILGKSDSNKLSGIYLI
jgi:hypothetical protein